VKLRVWRLKSWLVYTFFGFFASIVVICSIIEDLENNGATLYIIEAIAKIGILAIDIEITVVFFEILSFYS
jgi:hypothetical protein